MECYQKATALDLARAQYNIGYMYFNGLGVLKDNEEAIDWFKKAAEQGDEGAKSELEKLSRYFSYRLSGCF
ncbi:MAG: SEL1-like repeat protein [Synergistaceae bacterium]|nr:SEL1-like repeat protein [Synergistaceae bacterium]